MPKVIGIGAINIDFKIHDRHQKIQSNNFERVETLGVGDSIVEDKLNEAIYSNKQITANLGGAALWTIKTLGLIDPSIEYSYVGVYGQDRKFEERVGYKEMEMEQLTAKFADKLFFFTDDGPPGRGVDDVDNNVLDICPYVNDTLATKIKEREKELKEDTNLEPFINYLATAQWVHFSSLCKVSDFEHILGQIENAKTKNPNLKLSVDIGYDYTAKLPLEFHNRIFRVADVIVLTQKEAENIACNRRHVKKEQDLLAWVEIENEFRGYLDTLGAEGKKTVYITKSITRYGVISYGSGSEGSNSSSHEYDVVYPLDEKVQDARGSGSTFTAAIIANHFKPDIHHPIDNVKFAAYMAIIRKESGAAFHAELERAATKYRRMDGEIDQLNIVEDPERSIFISFSSLDSHISDDVHQLLLDFGIPKKDIFYTNNTTIPFADSFVQAIKDNIYKKPLVLVLNSVNYRKSEICNIELGAAWVIESKILPLISPALPEHNSLPIVIATNNGCRLHVAQSVLWLINEVQKFLGYKPLGDDIDKLDKGDQAMIKVFASKNSSPVN